MASDGRGWTKFGWQGITMEVPADWSLGAISGERGEGYFRLDDVEMPRMEVKWRDAQKGIPALPDVVQKYLDDLEKSVAKKKIDIRTENGFDISKMVRQLPEKDIHGFYWKSNTKAYGMATFCRECRRIVISQIVSPIETDVTSLVSRVFSSFEDHPMAGVELWAVYDMNFRVPAEFRLKDQKLMPGYLQFAFARENEPYTLEVERWGLTDVLLEGGRRSIREWYEGQYRRLLKGNKVKFEEMEIHGHQGFRVSGETARWFHEWRLAAERLTRSKSPTHLHAIFWHCPEVKKLFVVTMADRDPVNPVVSYLAAQIQCHEGGSSA